MMNTYLFVWLRSQHQSLFLLIRRAQTPSAKRALRPRKAIPPAETGHPETSKEFAKRIRKLVLHGPRSEPAEGVSPEDTNTDNQLGVTTVIESADLPAHNETAQAVLPADTTVSDTQGVLITMMILRAR